MHEVVGDLALFAAIELNAALGGDFGDEALHFGPKPFGRQRGDRRRIDAQQAKVAQFGNSLRRAGADPDGHDGGDEEEEEAAFGDIDVCTITLLDDAGKELGAYRLSEEFKEFNVVQLGSLLLGENGWEYAAVGNGFNGDFNDVLTHFS